MTNANHGSPASPFGLPPTAGKFWTSPFDTRPADFSRLLSGRALSESDVARAMAVDRSLDVGYEVVPLVDMVNWLEARAGHVVLLEGEAGEGKSTYLSLLAHALRDHATVFNWNPYAARTDWGQLVDHLSALSSLSSVGTKSGIVLAELPPVVSASEAELVRTALREHELHGGDVTILLAGRRGALRAASRGVAFETVRLAALNLDQSLALCSKLGQALELIQDVSPEEIGKRFPNLEHFVSQPPLAQAQNFAEVGQPLIVGLLRATYGPNFVAKLVGEYDDLADLDQRAYLHVCLGTIAGLGLTDHMLTRLAPGSNLDARSDVDPWVRTVFDEHVARHAVIAQTVLARGRVLAAVAECFGDLDRLVQQEPKHLPMLERLMSAFLNYDTVVTHDRRRVAQIRRRLASVLARHTNLDRHVSLDAVDSAQRLITWGSRLRRLALYAENSDGLVLLTVTKRVLEEALNHTLGQRDLEERIQYELGCALRDDAILASLVESTEELQDRLERWTAFVDHNWVTGRFYADLFDLAADLCRRLSLDSVPDRDSDDLHSCFRAAAVANVYLAHFNLELAKQRSAIAGELINRAVHYALPTRHIDVLRSSWEASRKWKEFSAPGRTLSAALLDLAKENPSQSEQLRREAVTVLKQVVEEFATGDPDAAYILSENIKSMPDLRAYLSPLLQEYGQAQGLFLATSALARANIETDPFEVQTHLRVAVDAYANASWNAAEWEHHGSRWESAVARLRNIGGSPLAADEQELKRARARYRRISR